MMGRSDTNLYDNIPETINLSGIKPRYGSKAPIHSGSSIQNVQEPYSGSREEALDTSSNFTEKNTIKPNIDMIAVPSELDETMTLTNNNLRILYITFAIVIGLLLLWIIIVVFTKEPPMKILNDMIDLATQIKPVSDLQLISPNKSEIRDDKVKNDFKS